jgi:hypothetical protein
MSASISFFSATGDVGAVLGPRLVLDVVTTFSISLSATHAPCTRIAFEAPSAGTGRRPGR